MEDGNMFTAKWQVPKGAYIRRNYDSAKLTHVLEFNSRGRVLFFNFINFIPQIINICFEF